MTSSHHAPYILGYTRTTMLRTKGSKFARTSKSHKPWLSSDRRLQLAYVKEESLVIAGQHTAVNTFPGLVHTARHTMEVGHARSRYSNPREEDVEGGADDWGEVVTRYPYRKVRMDHLLTGRQTTILMPECFYS